MTEKSLFWTTTASPSGDQVKSYTQDHMSLLSTGLGGANNFEGVVHGYKGSLDVTWGGWNVTVQPGMAIVDGLLYENDAALVLPLATAPTPRMDRVILRASWSDKTVRAAVLKGDTGSYPSPPALTQTPGTTYEIELAQVDVTGSGNTVHPERRKLASGIALPNIWAREYPGERNNWGDNTNTPFFRFYTFLLQPAMIQAGVRKITTSIGPWSLSVTFPQPFPVVPLVFATTQKDPSGAYRVGHMDTSSLSETGFSFYGPAGASGDDVQIHWLALGPVRHEGW